MGTHEANSGNNEDRGDQNQNESNTEGNLLAPWSNIHIVISFDEKSDLEAMRKLSHHLQSSVGAFAILVDELESNLDANSPPRQQNKVKQLRQHAHNNSSAIAVLVQSLNKHINERDALRGKPK